MNESNELEGILLIDKPSGMTSHDVVDRVRRKLKMKRIGHAGTLDPMATGLLIILVGKATKLSQYLTSLDKVYTGEVTLGAATNTYDAEGEVMTTKPVPELTGAEVKAAMDTYVGDQYQMPPMFSAVKIKGQPLYKSARKGVEVEREPRFIRISKLTMESFETPKIRFRMECSKGTYVRSVAHELGEKLGCGGHLSILRRTASDRFSIDDSATLDDFMEMEISEINKRLIAARSAVQVPIL